MGAATGKMILTTYLHDRGGAIDEGLGVHGLVVRQVRLGDLHIDVRLVRVRDGAVV
jgi:hypothetical protein